VRRRSVVIAGFAALLLAPERSAGQQTQSKIPRVGVLTAADSDRAPMFDAFREGLHDLGYVEGRNIILEFRLARGNSSLFPRLAAELVALPVDVVVLEGTGSFPAVNAVDPRKAVRGQQGRNLAGTTLIPVL
jgi:hypothetical protein